MVKPVKQDLSVNLAPRHPAGLIITNPVILASGTVAYGEELNNLLDLSKIGAIVCKGVTLRPREGNPQPRLSETSSGLLNSIGLQNVGAEAVASKLGPIWANWPVKVIANISGETIEEFGEIATILDRSVGISGIEVNIGCPNVDRGGIEFGTDTQSAANVTAVVKKSTSLPVMVKLTPNVTDITAISQAVAKSGADSISLVNTYVGMSIDVSKHKPTLSTITGGLSGPAIKPLALAMVYKVAGAVDVPVIGMGGIAHAGDALEYLMAGASAVQIGTANFNNPLVSLEVIKGIQNFMMQEGLFSITSLVGSARA